MLALSKILFFNTGINQLFKKQNEMSSFYSHFWKKKKKEERQVENIPADDLNTYISKFINRELKQTRRRRQQERHNFAYLTMKNSTFAHFARAFFIFGHLADVLDLSTT